MKISFDIFNRCKFFRLVFIGIFANYGIYFSSSILAQPYPTKPVTIVSPYGAGGNADLAARTLSASLQLSGIFSQPITVVNKLGAGGIAGSQFVKESSKDGYTLLIARVGSQVVAPALDPITPYMWNDFTIIGLLEIDPYVCVVKADSAYKSFEDLLSAIKQKPGKLTYASTGNFDASVVFPVKAFLNLGLDANAALKIPYKGAGDTVAALIGGQVDFACNGLSPYVGNLNSGQLRALVISTPSRAVNLPNTPTVSEVGMKNLEMVSGWSALYGPPGLPELIVSKWSDALVKLKSDTAWQSAVRKRGSIPTILSPEETSRFVSEQYLAYRALLPYFK